LTAQTGHSDCVQEIYGKRSATRGDKLGIIIMRFPPIPVKKVLKYALFIGLIGVNVYFYATV